MSAMTSSIGRLLWDVPISEEQFRAILAGTLVLGRFDRTWAAARLIDYGLYEDIIRELGYRNIVAWWPAWRQRVRSDARRRGMDFLVSYLREHRPEYCGAAHG